MIRDSSNIQRKRELSSPCLYRMRTDSDWPGTSHKTITVDQDMGRGERAVTRQARTHTTPVPRPSLHSRQHHQTHKQHKRTTEGPGLRDKYHRPNVFNQPHLRRS